MYSFLINQKVFKMISESEPQAISVGRARSNYHCVKSKKNYLSNEIDHLCRTYLLPTGSPMIPNKNMNL